MGKPICDDGEHNRNNEQPGNTDECVCDGEWQGSVETVGSFFAESMEVFDDGGDVCDGHEGHECAAEEDGVDEGLD
jgi:hypothetical protein